MQVLGLNLDWSEFGTRVESLVWLLAALAVAVAIGLALCASMVVLSAFREERTMPPESDFLGFGRPVRRGAVRNPEPVTVPARGRFVLARVAALAGLSLHR